MPVDQQAIKDSFRAKRLSSALIRCRNVFGIAIYIRRFKLGGTGCIDARTGGFTGLRAVTEITHSGHVQGEGISVWHLRGLGTACVLTVVSDMPALVEDHP